MRNQPTKIITHTSASGTGTTAVDISNWHFDRWGGYSPSKRGGATKYAGYHIVIEWDGTVVHCRNYDEEGIHCKGQNFSSIGVCFVGNGDLHYPSDAQKAAWKQLFPVIHNMYPNITFNDIYPHRKYANKTCHGKLLSDNYYTNLLDEQKITTLKSLLELLKQKVSSLRLLLAKETMK